MKVILKTSFRGKLSISLSSKDSEFFHAWKAQFHKTLPLVFTLWRPQKFVSLTDKRTSRHFVQRNSVQNIPKHANPSKNESQIFSVQIPFFHVSIEGNKK